MPHKPVRQDIYRLGAAARACCREGHCTKHLSVSTCYSPAEYSILASFEGLQAITLTSVSINQELMDCLGAITKLQHLDLICCSFPEQRAGSNMLAQSWFCATTHLTSINISRGRLRYTPDPELQLDSLSALTKLCRLKLGGFRFSGLASYAGLSSLTALHGADMLDDLTTLTNLHELTLHYGELTRNAYLFSNSFSVLSNLTYLGTGTFYGSHRSNILSMRVFPNLHKLRFYGSMRPDTHVPWPDAYEPDKYEDGMRVWDALAGLNCVKNLQLVHPDFDEFDDNDKHTYDILQRVGTMTHLTHLDFFSDNPALRYQHLDESLLHLSALTNLQVLRCRFPKADNEQPGDCGQALASILAQGSISSIDIDLHCDCCTAEECV